MWLIKCIVGHFITATDQYYHWAAGRYLIVTEAIKLISRLIVSDGDLFLAIPAAFSLSLPSLSQLTYFKACFCLKSLTKVMF
ncbi:hypothetical protein ACMGGR_09025 [Erwinia sp. BNK-24-b]|uniref:hypothetical protein n=1 Tax=unclassified Erwinia TaxID=2622719 RepID=UPI0039BF6038